MTTPGTTDPDSTALVIQAVESLGQSPSAPMFVKGGADPVTSLLSFQITSGPGRGALTFSPGTGPDELATYQGVPALAGVTVPFRATFPGRGYWLVASDGGVFTFGDAGFFGSTGAIALNKPIVGMASTPDGAGYWLVASDGGVFTFGDAGFFGSTGAHRPQQAHRRHGRHPRRRAATGWSPPTAASSPSVTPASSARPARSPSTSPSSAWRPPPTARGYWLVASDGGIFTFGDAGFFGSTGRARPQQAHRRHGLHPRRRAATGWSPPTAASSPSVTPASSARPAPSPSTSPSSAWPSTPDGAGYWLVASDGGVFTFGDAGFFGSTGGLALNRPIVGTAGPAGAGG